MKMRNKILVIFLLLANPDILKASEKPVEEMKFINTELNDLSFPKVVFMDWDNTVTNSWPLLLDVMNKTLVKHHRNFLTMAQFLALPDVNMPVAEIINGLFDGKRPDILKSYWEIHGVENENADLKIDDHVEELLEFLHKKQTFIAVVSNQEQAALEKNVIKAGLVKYFNRLVGAIPGQASKNKPEIGCIERALYDTGFFEQIGQVHEDWWFIGDGDTDMNTALNAKCLPVWVSRYAAARVKFFQDNEHVNNDKCSKRLETDSIKDILEITQQLRCPQVS